MFSAEISAADAVLLMLTTSLSRDLYKRFVSPGGERRERAAGGALDDARQRGDGDRRSRSPRPAIVVLLTIFYTLLTVSLFVPILAGLYVPRAATAEALAAIVCGVTAMVGCISRRREEGSACSTPALAGIVGASLAFVIVFAARHGGAPTRAM